MESQNVHVVAGTVAAKVTLSASVSVRHPQGFTWHSQWVFTTRTLGRLRQMYAGPPMNNLDMIVMVDSFMANCAHMWDAFANDPVLPQVGKREVQAAVNASPQLQLVRDYANTRKHLLRREPADIMAMPLEAGGRRPTGNYLTIGYGPADDMHREEVDALELAEAAYAAWRAFMTEHGIQEQVDFVESILQMDP